MTTRGKTEVLDHWQRHVIGDLTAEAMAEKKRQGEAVSRPGFGQRIVDGRLVVDEAEAAEINRIVALRAAGRTLQAIADTLTAERVPTKRGGKWAPGTILAILQRAQT